MAGETTVMLKSFKERLGAIMTRKKPTRAAMIVSAVLIIGAVLAACALGAGSKDNLYLPKSTDVQFVMMNQVNGDDSLGERYFDLDDSIAKIFAQLSDLYTQVYMAYYDGLRYEINGFEELTDAEYYTATFRWTMYHLDNGLDVASDKGKETQGNLNIKATAKLYADGSPDYSTLEFFGDNAPVGPPVWLPIEEWFPDDYAAGSERGNLRTGRHTAPKAQ
jgi:hypothetical protein